MKIIIAASMLLASLTAAIAFGLGGEGEQFGREGKMPDFTTVTLTPCTSTGVYDLSNTCNDIYFIGALK